MACFGLRMLYLESVPCVFDECVFYCSSVKCFSNVIYIPLVASVTDLFHILIGFLINRMPLIGRQVLKLLPVIILHSCALSFNFIWFFKCDFKAMMLVRTYKNMFSSPPPGGGILMANLSLLCVF